MLQTNRDENDSGEVSRFPDEEITPAGCSSEPAPGEYEELARACPAELQTPPDVDAACREENLIEFRRGALRLHERESAKETLTGLFLAAGAASEPDQLEHAVRIALSAAAKEALEKLSECSERTQPLGSVRIHAGDMVFLVRIRALFDVETVVENELVPLSQSRHLHLRKPYRRVLKELIAAPEEFRTLEHLLAVEAARQLGLGEQTFRFKWSIPQEKGKPSRMPIDFMVNTADWFSHTGESSVPALGPSGATSEEEEADRIVEKAVGEESKDAAKQEKREVKSLPGEDIWSTRKSFAFLTVALTVFLASLGYCLWRIFTDPF